MNIIVKMDNQDGVKSLTAESDNRKNTRRIINAIKWSKYKLSKNTRTCEHGLWSPSFPTKVQKRKEIIP